VAADLAGVTIPVGLAFGRIGCFFGGCCFGAECKLPWAVVFPPGSDASRAQWKAGALGSPFYASHPVHPTQLYEALFAVLVAAAALFVVWPRKRYHGQVFAFFLGTYAIGRGFIEILRRDDRGGFFGLSTSQLIGFGLLAVALLIHARKKVNDDSGRKEAR
jgi:phosphatidylglycerol:prolipoprotein diacylglycerol transferase